MYDDLKHNPEILITIIKIQLFSKFTQKTFIIIFWYIVKLPLGTQTLPLGIKTLPFVEIIVITLLSTLLVKINTLLLQLSQLIIKMFLLYWSSLFIQGAE